VTELDLILAEVAQHVPVVVRVDDRNRIIERRALEIPGPARRAVVARSARWAPDEETMTAARTARRSTP
jgi:hypothetical protein